MEYKDGYIQSSFRSILDAFLDEYHEWSLSGKQPFLASKELAYDLEQQKKRLKHKKITFEESYEHVKDEVTGTLKQDGHPYFARILYREANRILTCSKEEEIVKRYKKPVIFYATLLDKEGYEDFTCTCPNCGHQTLASKLQDGCPYCKTVFEIEDVYPCFTSFYNVNAIVDRGTLMDRITRNLKIVGIVCGVLVFILSLYTWNDYVLWFRILASLFMGALCGGVSAFVAYMGNSLLLLFKVFKEAGRSLPLLKGMNTKKKLEEKIKPYDPSFSYAYFEGRVLSLLRTIAFSERRDDLSIYLGKDDLSFFDDLIDMQYRGVLQLKKFALKDGYFDITIKAFMTNIYADHRIHQKDENYILSLRKEVTAMTDPGFSIRKIQCPNCGSSFDALHKRNCPHCASAYDLEHDDWVITEIRK